MYAGIIGEDQMAAGRALWCGKLPAQAVGQGRKREGC